MLAFTGALLRPRLDTLLLARCKGGASQFESGAGETAVARMLAALEPMAQKRARDVKITTKVIDVRLCVFALLAA